MAQARGSRTSYLFVEESSYGSTPSTPAPSACFKVPFTSDSLVQEINSFVSNEIRSDRMVPAIVQGNKRPQGSLNFELGAGGHARLIKHALGPTVTTTPGAGIYTHVIKGQSALPPGFTLEKAFNDIAQFFRYAGCRINRLNLNFPQEGFITCGVDVIGREETQHGATIQAAPTTVSEDPMTSFEAVLSEASFGSTFAQMATVQSATIVVANNLFEGNFVIGDRRRYNLPEGRRIVSGQMVVFFEDLSLYNKYINGTYAKLQIVATKGTHSFTILLPKIMFTGPSPTPQIPNDGPLVVGLPFQAVYDSGEATDIKVTIVNSTAAIS